MTDTVVRESADRSAGRGPESRTNSSRGQWRPLLVRMHFYAGVLVAPFVFLACLTGAIYVFNPQIERAVDSELLVVDHPGKTALPLNEQVAKAMASEPGLNVVSVEPSRTLDQSTRVNFSRPGGPDMSYHTAFVDPSTGKVLGSKDVSSMGGYMLYTMWLAQFHGDLGLGEFGRWYSEMASLWIVILTIGGIVVWWQRCAVHRKITSGKFWKKFGVVDRGKRPGVKRTMSWHSVIGVWTAVLALLFGLTGLPFARTSGPKWVAQTGNMHRSSVQLDATLPGSTGSSGTSGSRSGSGMSGKPATNGTSPSTSATNGTSPSTSATNGTSPSTSASNGTSGMDMSGQHDMSGMDMSGMGSSGSQGGGAPTAGATTGSGSGSGSGQGKGNMSGMPGMSGTGGSGSGMGHMTATGIPQAMVAKVNFDAMLSAADAAGVNQEIRISSPTRPGTGWTIAENKQDWPVAYDSALLDPKTSKVVRTLDWNKSATTVDKLNRYIMLFHFGRLFGFVGQVLFGVTMLAVMWIVWWGYKMWWQRRPRGTAWRLGKVPERGSWRKAPKVSLVIWGAATLAVFWVFPVLAVSTLGFLVLDVVLGRIRAARADAEAPAAG
jgi:uncharacterized iron-regulated membrane protein